MASSALAAERPPLARARAGWLPIGGLMGGKAGGWRAWKWPPFAGPGRARKKFTNWARAVTGAPFGPPTMFGPFGTRAPPLPSPVTWASESKSCSGDITFMLMWLNSFASALFSGVGLLVRWYASLRQIAL